MSEELECMESHDERTKCSGKVEYRMSLSGTGMAIERCAAHWAKRLKKEDEINRRYPSRAPYDFDPGYAGESWDGDW